MMKNSFSATGTDGTLSENEGNTKSSFSCKSRSYVLTWNNYEEADLEHLEHFCDSECDDYAFQPEIGANGTPHIQAAIRFKNPRSWKSVKDQFPKCHIEPTKGHWNSAKKYCMKEDTKAGPTRTKNSIIVKDPMEGLEFKWWQTKIDEIIKGKPDDRKIYWFVDKIGGSGKTTFCKHLALTNNGVLYAAGKVADVKYGISQMLEDGREPKIIIFDFVRSNETFVSYDAIETVKNGIFYSTKYESGMNIYNTPHVLIFSNFNPETSKLSKDRWDVTAI